MKVGFHLKLGAHLVPPPQIPQFHSISIPDWPDVAISKFGAAPHLEFPVGVQAQETASCFLIPVQQVGTPDLLAEHFVSPSLFETGVVVQKGYSYTLYIFSLLVQFIAPSKSPPSPEFKLQRYCSF